MSYLKFPRRAPRNVLESLQGSPREAQKLASMSQKELPRKDQEGARCPGMFYPFFFENVRSDLNPWGSHLGSIFSVDLKHWFRIAFCIIFLYESCPSD